MSYYRRLLQNVAAELKHRGAVALASLVYAAQIDLPFADELPDGPVGDDFIKTSDWGEELGVPPYSERRPKVKGDEPEN
jgi:hypothetical protein